MLRTSSFLLSILILAACDGVVPPLDGPSRSRSEPAAYIRGGHPSLVIELDVAPGLEPRAGVSDRVVETLTPLLDKPDGITVVRDTEIPPELLRDEWTFADVRALGDMLFDARGPDESAVLHTMWLPGRYVTEGGGTVLGVAWSNRHVAMFAESIDDACTGLLPLARERLCRESEAGVWAHEIGHVIGLVNNGIPMASPHEDPEHPAHTTDEDGVMYWAFESPNVGELLAARAAGTDGPLFAFGPASRADVAAYRD